MNRGEGRFMWNLVGDGVVVYHIILGSEKQGWNTCSRGTVWLVQSRPAPFITWLPFYQTHGLVLPEEEAEEFGTIPSPGQISDVFELLISVSNEKIV